MSTRYRSTVRPHVVVARTAWTILIAAAAAGAQQLQPGPAPAPGSFESRIARVVRDTVLANGLAVVSIENHAVPLVTVEVAVRTGAFTQEPGDEGVPHLFEHMLFKSYTGPRRSWGATMGELEAASYNGETGDEAVRYYITLPSASTEGGLRALAELVRDPDFTDDDLAQERHVVFDELDRDASDPIRHIYNAVGQRLWTTAWGRKDPGGDGQALTRVTAKRLDAVFHRYYVPNNSLVIVSGDVTAAQAFKLADERFGHWKRQPDPFASFVPLAIAPLPHPVGIIDQRTGLGDVLLLAEWQGPSVTTDPDGSYAADLLSTILDDAGSTFQARLVDSGLFTSCTVSYLTRANVGPIVLTAHTSLDSLPHALAALRDALQRLDAPEAFTDDELHDAQQSRRVETALMLEHRTAIAHELAEFWGSAGLPYFRTYADRTVDVSRVQLAAFARRYLVRKPFALGLLVPTGSGDRVQPSVVAFMGM